MASATTPLLLLLDGILSQDVERVQLSVSEMRTWLRRNASHPWCSPTNALRVAGARNDADRPPIPIPLMAMSPLLRPQPPPLLTQKSPSEDHNQNDPPLPVVDQDELVANQLLQSTPLLVALIQHVLCVFPEWARTCSSRDGSLPIHFAANLGSVAVADVLLDVVRTLCLFELLP